MLINRIKATEKHQIHDVVINIGLMVANYINVVSIKRGSRLAIKIAKNSSLIEVARVVVKKRADNDQLYCDSDEYVSCYQDQCIVQFISGKKFPVERYKETIGKLYSKIDLYLCNVSNVDRDVNLKVNKVMIHGNSNQAIFNHIKYQ